MLKGGIIAAGAENTRGHREKKGSSAGYIG